MARGDHIYVKRWGGAYYHHGIDMGDGTVVHFTGEPLRGRLAAVARDTWEDFCQGETPMVMHYPQDYRTPDEVVEAALAHLGTTGYKLLANNCEHFASYCKTGRAHSRQVRRAIQGMAITGATLSVAFLAGLIRRKAIRTSG
jgi:hypothetical protein